MKEIHAILAAFVIFSAGIITGGTMVKMFRPGMAAVKTNASIPVMPGVAQRMELLTRITKQLNLNVNQKEQVNDILNKSQDRSKKLWRQVYPQFQAEFDKTRSEIRELLQPNQRNKFDELLKQHAKKRAEESQSRANNRDRHKVGLTNEVQTNKSILTHNVTNSPIPSQTNDMRKTAP